ncbi:arginase family protein [Telmatocola sphagniphila]|uniref:Arginase family protein n=1 Tax=Telmatocola sphagniphila TaxID=1123043 RepID=A0A8E6B2S7_9BACT|nr:arginase family protein [Telmatocola sphagniphila]QVL30868.1 arginase family protein [Telmatocola sphagniphila]
MSITAIVFPFDLYGSPGTRLGAENLGDALREMRSDARAETQPARSQAYRDRLKIVEIPFETLKQYRSWLARGKKLFAKQEKTFPIWLSGNHLGVLPVYESLPADTLVLQFDAHLDIFNLAGCTEELSHGNFVMHAKPCPKLINLGHRDLFLPTDHINKYYSDTFSSLELTARPESSAKKLSKLVQSAKKIWIDIDCDVFDPAYLPAVAQPEPMGLSPLAVVGLLEAVWSKKVMGISFSEYLPARDDNDCSLAALCWMLEWVLVR